MRAFIATSKGWLCFRKLQQKPTYKPRPYEQMTHPGERIQIDVKFVPLRCLANKEQKLYQYTAIDEFTRLRFIYGYEEHSTYSSADFLNRAVEWYKRRGITVECVQTDNGCEFTSRFIQGLKDKPTLFQCTAAKLGIHHKRIRPYTPLHNGKNAATAKTTANSIPATAFIPVMTLISS